MKRHSFNEVSHLDDILYQLAVYSVTEGKIPIASKVNDVQKMQIDVYKTFNYFKHLVQSGECTIDFIEQDVLSVYGPFSQEKSQGEDDLNYEFITRYIREEEDVNRVKEDFIQKTQDVFSSLLKSFQKDEDNLYGLHNDLLDESPYIDEDEDEDKDEDNEDTEIE